jgi:hypothetical protein
MSSGDFFYSADFNNQQSENIKDRACYPDLRKFVTDLGNLDDLKQLELSNQDPKIASPRRRARAEIQACIEATDGLSWTRIVEQSTKSPHKSEHV